MNVRQMRRTGGYALVASALAVSTLSPAGVSAADASVSGHPNQVTNRVKPTIVLVHGAWADASSFAPVTALLQHAGYSVLNAPDPLRGLAQDAASVAAFVNQATSGPVVLVGHSYGGAVITNAARTTPTVKALVYVDAFAPAAGETIVGLTGAVPGSVLAAPPEQVFDVVQDPAEPAGDVDLYIKRSLFPAAFAARLPAPVTGVLAASQSPIAAAALQEPSGAPAWKSLPSWFVIGERDRIIPPGEQRVMAARAHGTVRSVDADHLSPLEKPVEVADTVDRAATSVR